MFSARKILENSLTEHFFFAKFLKSYTCILLFCKDYRYIFSDKSCQLDLMILQIKALKNSAFHLQEHIRTHTVSSLCLDTRKMVFGVSDQSDTNWPETLD